MLCLKAEFAFRTELLEFNYFLKIVIRPNTLWNFVQAGGLIPQMIQVCDYDILIVLDELNTLI